MLGGRGDRSEMVKGARFRVARRQVPGITAVSQFDVGLARRRKLTESNRDQIDAQVAFTCKILAR